MSNRRGQVVTLGHAASDKTSLVRTRRAVDAHVKGKRMQLGEMSLTPAGAEGSWVRVTRWPWPTPPELAGLLVRDWLRHQTQRALVEQFAVSAVRSSAGLRWFCIMAGCCLVPPWPSASTQTTSSSPQRHP